MHKLLPGDRVVLLRECKQFRWSGGNGQNPGDTGTVISVSEVDEPPEYTTVRVAWDNCSNDPCWVIGLLELTTPHLIEDTREYLRAVAE